MKVTFWGTRGSIPKPGPGTVRYGGNTSCVEVRAPDGTLIVLDCGTGAHDLGRALVASEIRPLRGHLLITHTHWDHIQGFPFFAPLFAPDGEWDVYAPQGVGHRLAETLAGQMRDPYFPLPIDHLDATVRYHDLVEGAFDLGAVRVTARYLNHPGLTLGYRLEAGGASVVYATDHEPHSPQPAGESVHPEDAHHVDFLAGADLVIHDSQYTLDEYPAKRSWGHTPAERAVDFAVAAGVKRLALFHHDPAREDAALERLLTRCARRAASAGAALEVAAAAEGDLIELAGPVQAPIPDALTRRGLGRPVPREATVLVVDDDPWVISLLEEVLTPTFRVLVATDGDAAVKVARAEMPDIVLLDWMMPGFDGPTVARMLRNDADPRLRAVPIVMLTGKVEPDDVATGFAAGVTDYLVKPFKTSHVLSRINTWLLRHHSRPPQS